MASLGKNKNRTWRAGVLRSYVRFLHIFSLRLREVAEDAFDFAEDGYVLD